MAHSANFLGALGRTMPEGENRAGCTGLSLGRPETVKFETRTLVSSRGL